MKLGSAARPTILVKSSSKWGQGNQQYGIPVDHYCESTLRPEKVDSRRQHWHCWVLGNGKAAGRTNKYFDSARSTPPFLALQNSTGCHAAP